MRRWAAPSNVQLSLDLRALPWRTLGEGFLFRPLLWKDACMRLGLVVILCCAACNEKAPTKVAAPPPPASAPAPAPTSFRRPPPPDAAAARPPDAAPRAELPLPAGGKVG